MNPQKENPENQIEEMTFDGSPSLDDFIRELEAKEKDLHISSDMVVEIEDSEVGEVDDSEVLNFLESFQEVNSSNGSAKNNLAKDYPAANNEKISRLESEIQRFREQVSKFEAERAEINEVMRRRQYDFDNYRKRTERERG